MNGGVQLGPSRILPAEALKTAAGRLRMSTPNVARSWHFVTGKLPLEFNEEVTGGASAPYNNNESAVDMIVGTSQGDKVIRQSKDYVRCDTGKSHLWVGTAVNNDTVEGVRKRYGIFDNLNGPFFEYDQSGGAYSNETTAVIRSNTSETVTEERFSRSEWNIDSLDGSQGSAFNLNRENINSYVIDYTWHGPGEVRFGFLIRGQIVWVHRYSIANEQKRAWSQTPELPTRFEIENVDGSSQSSTLKHGASAIIQDGSKDANTQGIFRGQIGSTSATTIARNGTYTPLVAIRPKRTLASGKINRQPIFPRGGVVHVSDQVVHYRIVYNPSFSVSTWNDVSTESSAQYAAPGDISSYDPTVGEVLPTDLVAGGNKGKAGLVGGLQSDLVIANGINTSNFDTLVLDAKSLTNNSPDGHGILKWKEYQS